MTAAAGRVRCVAMAAAALMRAAGFIFTPEIPPNVGTPPVVAGNDDAGAPPGVLVSLAMVLGSAGASVTAARNRNASAVFSCLVIACDDDEEDDSLRDTEDNNEGKFSFPLSVSSEPGSGSRGGGSAVVLPT